MKVLAINNKKAVSNKKAVENHAPALMANKKAVAHDTFVKSCKK